MYGTPPQELIDVNGGRSRRKATHNTSGGRDGERNRRTPVQESGEGEPARM